MQIVKSKELRQTGMSEQSGREEGTSKTIKSVGLLKFLKGNADPKAGMPGCANYDSHYGDCLLRTVKGKPNPNLLEEEKSKCICLVGQGQRCGYFEKAVLPTGDDGIRQKYESLTGVYIEGKVANICGDCGAKILPRRRYCDNCVRKRRKATYRRKRDNQNAPCATVN